MAQQSEKKETRFDKRVNWIKDHKFFSWVLLIAFIVAPLVTIITVYGDTAPRIKNFVRDIKSIGDPEVQPALKTIRQYYDDQATGSVVVSNYFAPKVEQFITLKNPTHEEIQSSFLTGRDDFSNPEMKILDSTFSFSKDPDGNESVDFWGAFTCYRKTKKKYQSCLVRVAFVFDQDGKIKSLAELQQKNLKFYNKAIQMEGTVGKLSAVFNLTFDYEKNKVAGTYYYPSRKGIVYSISGTISGTRLEFQEYTNGLKTASCALETNDNLNFEGTMLNTDGRRLKMTMRSEQPLFL